MKTHNRIVWTMVIILASVISWATPVSAREYRGHERSSASYHAYNSRESAYVRVQDRGERRPHRAYHAPARHVPVMVRNQRYYFLDGIFYRQGLHGYIAVGAPVGAIVVSLPVGSSTVMVAGTRYSVYGGVYYRHMSQGYEVVRKPYTKDAPCRLDDRYEVAGQVRVTTHALNVREGPGRNHKVISHVFRHDILKIMGSAPGWLYVHLPCGKYGWVMNEYVAPMGPVARG